jgi:hypothetical protein
MVLGLITGLQKAGPLCGSPLIPESSAAEAFDTLHRGSAAAAECYRSINSAALPTWIMIALGVLLVLTGVAIRIIEINRHK